MDIAGAINKMRHQRMKMVQTPVRMDNILSSNCELAVYLQEQYIFIHDAILESVTCGDTEISSANLRLIMKKMSRVNPETKATPLQTQFKVQKGSLHKAIVI